MSTQKGNNETTQTIRSVQEVVDHALMEELTASGMTAAKARQEVIESRQVADRYDELMAEGYTDEQIGALWADKTPQEILSEARGKKAMPRTSQRRIRKSTTLDTIPQQK